MEEERLRPAGSFCLTATNQWRSIKETRLPLLVSNTNMGRKKILKPDQILEVIESFLVNAGHAPTVEELRRKLEIGSTRTILRYLDEIERSGAIRRRPGARGIQLLKRPGAGTTTIAIPIVGEAPAGPLMVAEENLEAWVRIPADLLKPGGSPFFLLRVRGDSMNQARVQGGLIENGDLAVVRQQGEAEPGQIVVALIDGEATIKRLTKGIGFWVLKPESSNRSHQPIILTDEFRVQGVVVRILKRGTELLADVIS